MMTTSVRKNKLKECLLLLTMGILSLTCAGQESSVITVSNTVKSMERIVLEWNGHESVDHYYVERSTDGIHFSSVALVFGNIIPGESMLCRFKDTDHVEGQSKIYYRVLVVKKDKSSTYAPASMITSQKQTISR